MPPADHEAEAGKNVALGGDPARINMTGDVIHGNKRNAPRQSQHLGRGNTDQQGADQSRRIVNGDAINLRERDSGPGQSLVDDRKNLTEVRSACNFRDDASEPGMEVILRRHDIRENL
jgi:hypothetical protein